MKLWRQKQVGNPHNKIPKSRTEYIETNELPDTLCKTADGADFLFYVQGKNRGRRICGFFHEPMGS